MPIAPGIFRRRWDYRPTRQRFITPKPSPQAIAVVGIANNGSYNQGSVFVGVASFSDLTIINNGSSLGTLGVLSISGTDWSITVNPSNLTIAPGATRTVRVSITASTTGARPGILTIPSDDPVTPTYTVNLTATGVSPTTTASVPFGTRARRRLMIRRRRNG